MGDEETENRPVTRLPFSVSVLTSRFSLRLFVIRVLAATATELAEFQPIGRGLLILGRHVIPTLTHTALKHYVIAWHKSRPTLHVL
jgi:hypothetical protein